MNARDKVASEPLSFQTEKDCVSTITDELEVYLTTLLPFKAQRYQSNVCTTPKNHTLASLLCEKDPLSTLYVSFEKWHSTALLTLDGLSGLDDELDKAIQLLVDRISSLYSRVLMQSLANWDQPRLADVTLIQCQGVTTLEHEISIGVRQFCYSSPLSFLDNQITRSSNPTKTPFPLMASVLGLDYQDNNSHAVIDHLIWIDAILLDMRHQADAAISSERIHELITGIEEHRNNVITHIESERIKQENAGRRILMILHKVYYPLIVHSPTMVMTALMVLSLRLIYHLPTRSVAMFLSHISRNLLSYGIPPSASEDMMHDPRFYQHIVDLEVEEESYAICPTCASSYLLDREGEAATSICTSLISSRSGNSQCAAKLFRETKGRSQTRRPIQVFCRRTLSSWLKGLLGRPGLVKTLDAVWRQAHGPPHNPCLDFWGGSFIRQMKGPDSKALFSTIPTGETRLLFSLAVDWFNPFHNKIAGKNVSSGVIFMTCLNIPLEERYKEDNVFLVGLMPGRKQAPQLDGILQILVDELLPYWKDGVSFLGIPSIKHARHVRCALVQLICDLPAARKVAGFPGHGAKYGCSVCFSNIHEMADLKAAEILPGRRTKEDHMKYAHMYNQALKSVDGRKSAEKILKSNPHGVRWSPLNDLPYWDPIKCTVLDTMHLVLLGLCQIHWRRFWHADSITKSKHMTRKLQTVQQGSEYPLQVDPVEQPHASEHHDQGECIEGDAMEGINGDHAIPPSYLEDEAKFSSVDDLLDAKKMKEARHVWLYGTEKGLSSNLSIAQILCLLKENCGNAPNEYVSKDELVNTLKVCRHGFSDLPQVRPRVKGSKPAQLRRASHCRPTETTPLLQPSQRVISPSEKRLLDHLSVPIPWATKTKGTSGDPKISYISRSELEEIQKDICDIVVPSWVTKLSRNFGEKSNGKVKADEWRSLFAIYLPMTLTRLWTDSKEPWADFKRRALHLKALLALSILVNIVCSRSASTFGTELYRVTIEYYLTLMSELCPSESLVISHHLALHLPEFIQLHGPSRTHWAFPFERLIGRLQKIFHNSHDIPSTLSKSFWSAVSLRSLVSHGVQVASLPRWSGRTKDGQGPKSQRVLLDQAVIAAVRSFSTTPGSWASQIERITVRDVEYRSSCTGLSVGNANIGYFSCNAPSIYRVGRIGKILIVKTNGGKDEVVLLVHCYCNPPPGFNQNLWNQVLGHRAIGMKIVGVDVVETPEVIPLAAIVGHVAIKRMTGVFGQALVTLQLTKDIEARRLMPTQ